MTARYRTDRLLSLDLELTCDDPSPQGWKAEIIQLGVVELDTVKLAITRSASYLVRPTDWNGITPFCTKLTGISKDSVKRQGRPFPEALATFRRTFGPGAKTIIGWGRDEVDIANACAMHGIPNPLEAGSYINIASVFRMLIGHPHNARMGLEDAMECLGLAWPGRQHDALVDATATAMVWCQIAQRVRAFDRDSSA
jgi:3'-5' exoribonuclease 1